MSWEGNDRQLRRPQCHFRRQAMRLFRWLQAGKPFLHVGCGFSLPGSSDKSLAFYPWMGTLRLLPEALRFFD